jgi:hypothetical protein
MREGGYPPTSSPFTKKKPVLRRIQMQGLDNHFSALWVANERSEAEGKPTVKYTITVAVEGFVQIDVEATSRSKAVDQAFEIFNDSNINIVVTDKSIADVEEWK